jgi:uncharacterized protein
MTQGERLQSGGKWSVSIGDEAVTALYEPGIAETKAVFVCAHGAGGNMYDRSITATANALREHGVGVVRYNFQYTEKGSKRPDPMPRLKECVKAVVGHTREELSPELLVMGGRSMGGRASSMLAADGFDCDGLLLLAYPLHPAGQPTKLRDAHLSAIKMPVICFSGTRDPLCDRSLMENALKTVTTDWEMHWVEGADHSFHVLKSSGRTDPEVLEEIGSATESWVRRIATSS